MRPAFRPCPPVADPLSDDDAALALYVLYELHYRGFEGVDEGWEWEPSPNDGDRTLTATAIRPKKGQVLLRDLLSAFWRQAPRDVAEL